MATKVRGITIEIGGDASGLEKSLKEVNSEIKNTSSQLKDVEKLLKLDPKNTELLEQKYKLLSESIGETERKLQSLRDAEKEMQQAVRDGKASQEQYDALEREIAETEIALRKLKDQQDEFANSPNLELISKTFNDVGDKLSAVGDKLLKVTGVITGLGGLAVNTAADFDEGMSKVQAISGASEEDMAALIEKAREMGATTKFSASEAAEALTYMAMAGWKTEDMLSGIEGIMQLAAASGEGLGTTSDIVTDALTAFGLNAEDSARFADILATASSNSNTNVSMMGETFKYVAPIAGALGYSVEDVATAIGILANNGIKSSQAGTSLRRIFTALNGKVELASESMGDMVIETVNADGSMRDLSDILADLRTAFGQMTDSEKAANAENIAGKNALSGFLALVETAPSDVEKLSKAIENSSGSAKEMSDIMLDNLNGRLTILKSTLEETAIGFGELLIPAIEDVVQWIKDLLDWINSLDDDTKNIITTVGLVIAALGPLLSIVGRVSKLIGTLIQHPYVAIGLLVVGAITGIVTAIKNANEEEQARLDLLTEEATKIKDASKAYSDMVDEQIESNKQIDAEAGAAEVLWKQLQEITDENGHIKDGFEDQAFVITSQLNEALGTSLLIVGDQVKGYQQVRDTIDEIIQKKRLEAMLDANKESYQKALQDEAGLLENVLEAESNLRDSEEQLSQKAIELEAAQTELNDAMSRFGEVGRNGNPILEELGRKVTNLSKEHSDLEYVVGQNREALEAANDAYSDSQAVIQNYENVLIAAREGGEKLDIALTAMSKNLKTAATADEQTLRKQAESYETEYENMRKAVENGDKRISQTQLEQMQGLVQITKRELQKVTGEWQGALDNTYSKAYYSGKELARGFAAGINDWAYLPSNAAGSMARQANDKVNAVLGVNSPSKAMMETGKFVDQGFAEGILNNLKYVTNAATAMTQPLTDLDLAMSDSMQAQTMAAGISQPIILQITQPINLGGKLIGQAVTENVINRISGRQELEAAYLGW